MKYINIFNAVFALALTSVVSAQNTCSTKITEKGYQCCSAECVTTYTDEDGDWAVENGKWCGCGNPLDETNTNTSKCSANITKKGYSCCPSDCIVTYMDSDGTWGIHNNQWCG
ncbi:Non-catalytic module family DOC2, partial [Piromyces sp. E2]